MQRAFGFTLTLTAFLALAAPQTGRAQTTLDFENLPNSSPTGTNGQGASVSQNGFTIRSSNNSFGFYSVTPSGPSQLGFNYTGSVAIANANSGQSTILTQDSGGAFSLLRVNIANVSQARFNQGGSTSVFTGTLLGGGTVTQTFTVAATDALQTFTLNSSFTNLVSVGITQSGNTEQFDNFMIGAAVVPEPGSLAYLALLTLTGGAILRRRKTR